MTPLAALFRRADPDPRRDGELLAAFLRDRDEPAFAELVRRHGPLVWGACRRALPDEADAEDAFQATFLVLVRRAGRLTAAATVGPWLLTVATLTARNARRKNARRLARAVELRDVPDPRPAPDPSFDIGAALGGLSVRCRTAVLLTHLEGLTHREAADRLGCAEGTVSSLVSRGLARLRARLAGRDPAALLTAAAVAVPAGVAAGGGDGPPDAGGLGRAGPAAAGGRLPAGRAGDAGAGQPEHPPRRVAVRGVPGGRGPRPGPAAGPPAPRSGSWLNMAGIERGILARQCLDRRIGTKDELTRQVAAWPEARNADGCQVTWRFTTADARIKLAHPYPRN